MSDIEKEMGRIFGEETELDTLIDQKSKDGWEHVGSEDLTITPINSEAEESKDIMAKIARDLVDKYSKNGEYLVQPVMASDGKVHVFIKLI